MGEQLNKLVMGSVKEFAEKTGYKGPFPSAEVNKGIVKQLNDAIRTQQKGLMELSKTAV